MTMNAYDLARERIRQCEKDGGDVLDLGMLGLTALPPEIGRLTALTTLYVWNNKLEALPPEIGRLTALTTLEVRWNKLTALPPDIGRLTALTDLNLWDNQLTALPPEIGRLTALTTLSVGYNKLTALPPELGRLTALTRLDVAVNKLTALPPEIERLTALTALSLGDNKLAALPQWALERSVSGLALRAVPNPLVEPPLRIVEAGPKAIGTYLAFLRKRGRGGWVAHGSRLSRHFRLRSVLAAVETVLATGAMAALAHFGVATPVWIAVAVAPLLLLKTRASTTLGTRRFAWLLRKLGLKNHNKGMGSALLLPLRLLGLGIGSMAIKLVTTPYALWRRPTAAMKAMPANLREQCLEIDTACPPELVPGLERAYDSRPHDAFLISDILRPYARRDTLFAYFFDKHRPKLMAFLSAPILLVFFLVATVYRWYAKGAVVIYLPLLLVDLPDRARLLKRTAPGKRGARGKPVIQMAVAAAALFGLAAVSGYKGLQAAIAVWLDERLLILWETASVSQWLPKMVLFLFFIQALIFLGAKGAERLGRGARADEDAAAVPSAVARRWIAIAQFGYAVHVGLIVALLAAIYVAVAPNVILIWEKLSTLLF